MMAKPTETRYCPICGEAAAVHGLQVERFGETFCSDGHAEEFVRAVRTARVQAVTRLAVEPPTAGVEQPAGAGERPGPQGWKRYLTLGACCAVPLLALVVLAGGGGALLGAAGALLPVLVLLACPLAMYLMMRGMQHHGKTPQASESEGDKRPEPSSAGDPGMKRPSRSGNEGF